MSDDAGSAMEARELLALWDELRFGMLVHRTVADVTGFSSDLSRGFTARAELALDELESHLVDTEHTALRGDGERRRALLRAFLGFPEQDIRTGFGAADDAYRNVVVTADNRSFADEFSRTLMSLERTVTLRSRDLLRSEDEPADASPELLRKIGLAHVVDLVQADRLANALRLGATAPLAATSRPARDVHHRERGILRLTEALVHLEAGDRARADTVVVDALRDLEAGHYGLFDGLECHLDELFAHFLRGMTAAGETTSISSFDRAVLLIEEVRGGWRMGSTHSDPLWPPFERMMGQALRQACRGTSQSSAWTAVRIMEAMRRRHLAGMLRAARFLPDVTRRDRRSRVVSVTDLISLDEDHSVRVASESSGTGVGGRGRTRFVRLPDGRRLAVEPEDALGAELSPEDARAEIARLVSDFFADAFLPDRVDLDQIRHVVAGRFAIEYVFLDDDEFARWWVDPAGEAHAEVVAVSVTLDHLEEMDVEGSPRYLKHAALGHAPRFGHIDLAELTSAALLPHDLRVRLAGAERLVDIVVVPDAWLASTSWAALTVATGERVITTADIFVAPGLSLLDEEPGGASAARLHVIGACVDYPPDPTRTWVPLDVEGERDALTTLSPPVHRTIDAWLDGVATAEPSADWAFVACHGDDLTLRRTRRGLPDALAGMGAELVEADHTRVTVLDVMTVEWPPLVVFAGCFTGRLGWSVRSGLAPLGLAVAVMSRGASSVIGGSHLLPDGKYSLFADHDGRGLIADLAAATDHPGRVLGDTQRALLARQPSTTPFRWARNVTITRQLPPVS